MPARKNKVTSSANRSKRKTTKPVSSDKGRRARARVSTAKVSSSEGRQSTGSARVTGGSQGTRRGAAKPSGRQPRAITNGRSATMRQIRAKAVQARRMAQGKSTVASRQEGITPSSARGQRIKAMASRQRVIGDSGQTRAAATTGRKLAAQAKAKRGAKQAIKRMENKLQGARTLRAAKQGLGAASVVGAAKAGLTAYNTTDGTLTAAKKRGDLAKRRKPTPEEAKSYRAQETKAKAANAKRKTVSFDDAFRDARRAGANTFTWRGKKYTTEMK